MPSSGRGNSHDQTYRECRRKFYYSYRLGRESAGVSSAPPLLVGEACHAFAQHVIEGWLAQGSKDAVLEDAWQAYTAALGYVDPDEFDLVDRDRLARCVLPLWAMRQWKKFEDGDEVPLATEKDLYIILPPHTPYGPIREELRKYTARLDYVYRRRDGFVVIKDHKFSASTSPESEAKHYLMSDQHTGYVYVWNAWRLDEAVECHEELTDEAAFVEYDITRLQAKVTSASAHWSEVRNVDMAQQTDWYTRLLALRAEMSRMWDLPRECWVSNTAPHGPCHKWGRDCDFKKLCAAPSEHDARLAQYLSVAQDVGQPAENSVEDVA